MKTLRDILKALLIGTTAMLIIWVLVFATGAPDPVADAWFIAGAVIAGCGTLLCTTT